MRESDRYKFKDQQRRSRIHTTGIPQEAHQINGAQQKLKSITQENFPEIKDDFLPQIKMENTWENRPKKVNTGTYSSNHIGLEREKENSSSGYPG